MVSKGSLLPFILGLGVGVIFNDTIRQGWSWLRGQVPQVPDIPSFGGISQPAATETVVEAPQQAPVQQTAYAYAYKADFEKDYETHLETINNGIHYYSD